MLSLSHSPGTVSVKYNNLQLGPQMTSCAFHLISPFLHTTATPQNAPSPGRQGRTFCRLVQRNSIPPPCLPLSPSKTHKHRDHVLPCTPSISSSFSPHLGCQAHPAWPQRARVRGFLSSSMRTLQGRQRLAGSPGLELLSKHFSFSANRHVFRALAWLTFVWDLCSCTLVDQWSPVG